MQAVEVNLDEMMEQLKASIANDVRPFIIAGTLLPREVQEKIVDGIVNNLLEILGIFLGSAEVNYGLRAMNTGEFPPIVEHHRAEFLARLATREKEMRTDAGIGLDA